MPWSNWFFWQINWQILRAPVERCWKARLRGVGRHGCGMLEGTVEGLILHSCICILRVSEEFSRLLE
jgi:hypothetical protein